MISESPSKRFTAICQEFVLKTKIPERLEYLETLYTLGVLKDPLIDNSRAKEILEM